MDNPSSKANIGLKFKFSGQNREVRSVRLLCFHFPKLWYLFVFCVCFRVRMFCGVFVCVLRAYVVWCVCVVCLCRVFVWCVVCGVWCVVVWVCGVRFAYPVFF